MEDWIRIGERLPKEHERVEIAFVLQKPSEQIFCVTMGAHDRKNGWVFDDDKAIYAFWWRKIKFPNKW